MGLKAHITGPLDLGNSYQPDVISREIHTSYGVTLSGNEKEITHQQNDDILRRSDRHEMMANGGVYHLVYVQYDSRSF